MSEIVKRYEEKRSLSEKIASYIPGYRGYKQKEVRREADKLVRDFMVRKLSEARGHLKDATRSVAEAEAAQLYKLLNRVSAVMDRVINKIEHADYGYSGLFDLVKVREEELDKLLEYDHGLLSRCEEIVNIAAEVSGTAAAGSFDVLPGKLKQLELKLQELQKMFASREEIITSVRGG
ncbi:MAG: hypothetical protein QXY49_04745 [Thermofilaceae archaeon]